ncbi:MAG: hypothetical protein IT434_03235 [Phycisphaerales bacterium]|nr:hypothetical protein [Phycisphaerales bacterium]
MFSRTLGSSGLASAGLVSAGLVSDGFVSVGLVSTGLTSAVAGVGSAGLDSAFGSGLVSGLASGLESGAGSGLTGAPVSLTGLRSLGSGSGSVGGCVVAAGPPVGIDLGEETPRSVQRSVATAPIKSSPMIAQNTLMAQLLADVPARATRAA